MVLTMAIISPGFVARTRERGLAKTAKVVFGGLFVRPVLRKYSNFKTRNAPLYVGPTETELCDVEESLGALGVSVKPLVLSRSEFDEFKRRFSFPADYHGGKEGGVYDEKLLEHFIAYNLSGLKEFGENDIYVDVAACASPWAKILRKSDITAFAIDLELGSNYKSLDYYRHADATQTFFDDSSVAAMSLQCAYEMFSGDDDWKYLEECRRILKPGGTVVISPLYMHKHECGYSTAEYYLKGHADENARQYVRRSIWGVPYSRKYSAESLKNRVLDRISQLGMTFTLYKLENKPELGENIYCHFILAFTKK
jgi:SAM-dependent methyltransferase